MPAKHRCIQKIGGVFVHNFETVGLGKQLFDAILDGLPLQKIVCGGKSHIEAELVIESKGDKELKK
jgi:hypothetical protein